MRTLYPPLEPFDVFRMKVSGVHELYVEQCGKKDGIPGLALPVLVGLASSLGSNVRFYRTVFLEETGRDYVRTARAKGAAETRIMARHVLRNGLLPILTSVVAAIPFLFTGSLLLETFFAIPGLGAVTVEAIEGNDFSTLRTMVFIGSLLFIAAQIATDISYTLADPRVRLG